MSVKRKYRLETFLPWDGAYVERHLEKMARKGWRLEKAGNPFWTYRKAEPANLHYAMTYFPTASVFDSDPTEEQETYADYCAAAGWEMVSAYGPLQIFVNERPHPVPIETDEREKLAAIHGGMKKMLLLPFGILLPLLLLTLVAEFREATRYAPLSFVSSDVQLGLLVLDGGLAAYVAWILLAYLIWYNRSQRAVEAGGACRPTGTRLRRIATRLFLAVLLVASAALLLREPVMWVALPLVLGLTALLMVAIFGCFWWLKSLKLSRKQTRAAYFAAAVVLSLVFRPVTQWSANAIKPLLPSSGHSPVSSYTVETKRSGDITYDIYQDDIPLTLEDLGYTVTEEDHCSYWGKEQSSVLALWSHYRQDAYGENSTLPTLDYQTADIPWTGLREWCWENLSGYYGPYGLHVSFEETDAAPWEADRAMIWPDSSPNLRYLLLYGDRIVVLTLGFTSTAEQRSVITAALRS